MGNKLSLSTLNPFRRSGSSGNVSSTEEVKEPESDVASGEGQVSGEQPQELQGAEISSNVTVNGSSGDEQQVSGSESSGKEQVVNGVNGEEDLGEKDNEAEGKEYVFKPVSVVAASNGHNGESQENHDGFSNLDMEQINSQINFGSHQNDAVKTVVGEVDEMESLTESDTNSLADSDLNGLNGRNMRKRKPDSELRNSPSPGKRGKKGINLSALPPHATYVESLDRPFICGEPNCTWSFKQLFHLQRHHKKVHEGKSQNSSGRSSVTGSSVSTSTGEAIYQQALHELVVEYPSEYVPV